jgi:hypothetical protein
MPAPATFSGRSPIGWIVVLLTLAALGVAASIPQLSHADANAPFVALVVAVVVLGAWPTRYVVGDDGLLVRWLGRVKFVSYADVTHAAPAGDDVKLSMRSGPSLVVRTGRWRRGKRGTLLMRDGDEDRESRSLLSELEPRMERFRVCPSAREVEALTDRRGRDVSSWLADLQGLLAAKSYREGAVDPEGLWKVLEDPSAAPRARVGAAVALRGVLDDEGRARIRVAAATTALGRVCDALQTASSGSTEDHDVAVERAMRRLP